MAISSSFKRPGVLVTGAHSFVGEHIVRALRQREYLVRAMSAPGSASASAQGRQAEPGVERVEVAFGDSASVDAALKGCGALVYIGAFSPPLGMGIREARRRGVAELRGIFDACARAEVERIVYLSNAVTLGAEPADPRGELSESDYYLPGSQQDAFVEAKWAMEAEVYRYMLRGFGAAVMIPGLILGPGGAESTLGPLIRRLARAQLPGLIGQHVNLIDVRDLAEGLVKGLERGRAGRRYIVGGQNLELRLVAAEVSALKKVKAPTFQLPAAPIRRAAQLAGRLSWRLGLDAPALAVAAEHLALSRPLNDERARAELSHQSRPWRETLADMLETL